MTTNYVSPIKNSMLSYLLFIKEKIITYRNSVKKNKTIFLFFIVGLLLRVILMPFFAHSDIFSTYRRAANMVIHGGVSGNEPLIHIIEAVWLRILDLLSKDPNFISHIFITPIYDHSQVNEYLFLFKILYLFAEILTWLFLFTRIIKPSITNLIIVLFNPVILYSVYIFGRYETFSILAIVIVFAVIQHYRDSLKYNIMLIIALSVMIFIRPPLILLVAPILLVNTSLRSKIALFSVPMLIYGLYIYFDSIHATSERTIVNWLSEGHHTNFFFQMGFMLQKGIDIYIFFTLISLVIMFYIRGFFIIKNDFKNSLLNYSMASFVILSLYYATSIFHPHYMCWILPFFFVLINMRDDYLKKSVFISFAIISLLFLFIPLSFGNGTTFGLAFPISDIFVHTFTIHNIIFFYDIEKLSNVARSILSGVYLYLIIEITRYVNQQTTGDK